MKIVSPSFEILPENKNILKQIEERGRICYKSEDKITEDSHLGFFNKILRSEHGSVLEMAVIHIRITSKKRTTILNLEYVLSSNKFIKTSLVSLDDFVPDFIVSGSIRAFFEMEKYFSGYGAEGFGSKMVTTLKTFVDEVIDSGSIGLEADDYTCELLDNLDEYDQDIINKHKYVAVKFIVSRAVSHELVRHRPASFLQESQRYCRYAEDKFGNEVTFIEPMFFNGHFEEWKIWRKSMEDAETAYLELLKTCSPQAARTVLPNSCKTEIIMYTSIDHWKLIFGLRTSQAAEPSMREVMIPLQEEFKRLGYVE